MILFWTVDDEVLKIGMVSQWLRWVGDMIIIKKPSAKTKVIWSIDEEKILGVGILLHGRERATLGMETWSYLHLLLLLLFFR